MYNKTVMDHFRNPRNVGVIENPDGVGEVGNPLCGDMMTIYLSINNDQIQDIKFQTFGCGAAIAVSSMVSEMAMGKTVEEAMKITNKSVAEELGGLPTNKMHCSNLGADALHKAIENYQERQKVDHDAPDKTEDKESCYCPYCEGPIEGMENYCQSCDVEFESCPECDKSLNKKADKCPHCGATKVRV